MIDKPLTNSKFPYMLVTCVKQPLPPKIRITLEMDSNQFYSANNLAALQQNVFDLVRRIELDLLHSRVWSASNGVKLSEKVYKALKNAQEVDLAAAKQLIESMKIEIVE